MTIKPRLWLVAICGTIFGLGLWGVHEGLEIRKKTYDMYRFSETLDNIIEKQNSQKKNPREYPQLLSEIQEENNLFRLEYEPFTVNCAEARLERKVYLKDGEEYNQITLRNQGVINKGWMRGDDRRIYRVGENTNSESRFEIEDSEGNIILQSGPFGVAYKD